MVVSKRLMRAIDPVRSAARETQKPVLAIEPRLPSSQANAIGRTVPIRLTRVSSPALVVARGQKTMKTLFVKS
jgi:hypothetical protein